MSVSFILSGDTLTVFIYEKSYSINTEHFNFKRIAEILKSDEQDDLEELKSLLEDNNPLSSISRATDGVAEYVDGKVFLNGQEVHSVIADRIRQLIQLALPIDPLLRFMENLEKNPSFRSRNSLFDFLEHKGLPITDDGFFLAYKAVTKDFKDKHTGRIDNSIGTIVKQERRDVDDDPDEDCSYGLHVGTNEYTDGFAGYNDRIIIVKINPEHVVTVPAHDKTKMRVCEYEVLFEKTKVYSSPLVTPDGDEHDYDDYEEDYDEFLDEWEEEDNEY